MKSIIFSIHHLQLRLELLDFCPHGAQRRVARRSAAIGRADLSSSRSARGAAVIRLKDVRHHII